MADLHRRRVADDIKRRLNELIQRRVKDPRLDGVSVQEVALNVDMRVATVRIVALGQPELDSGARTALERATGFLRSELGKAMRLRHTPELRFVSDDRLGAEARIDELLAEARRETGEAS